MPKLILKLIIHDYLVVCRMNRNGEVTYLKEMNLNCRHMSLNGVDLVNFRLDDQFSTGYQVRVQTVLGN